MHFPDFSKNKSDIFGGRLVIINCFPLFEAFPKIPKKLVVLLNTRMKAFNQGKSNANADEKKRHLSRETLLLRAVWNLRQCHLWALQGVISGTVVVSEPFTFFDHCEQCRMWEASETNLIRPRIQLTSTQCELLSFTARINFQTFKFSNFHFTFEWTSLKVHSLYWGKVKKTLDSDQICQEIILSSII